MESEAHSNFLIADGGVASLETQEKCINSISRSLENSKCEVEADIGNNVNSVPHGSHNPTIPQVALLKPGTSHDENQVGESAIQGDNCLSNLSPPSDSDTEDSEMEINLEPPSADESNLQTESTVSDSEVHPLETVGELSQKNQPRPPVNESAADLSDDKEDVSDVEIELDSSTSDVHSLNSSTLHVAEGKFKPVHSYDQPQEVPEVTSGFHSALATSGSLSSDNNDTRISASSTDREIIDLNFEDSTKDDDVDDVDHNFSLVHQGEDFLTVSSEQLPVAARLKSEEFITLKSDISNSDPHPEVSHVDSTNSYQACDVSNIRYDNTGTLDPAMRSKGETRDLLPSKNSKEHLRSLSHDSVNSEIVSFSEEIDLVTSHKRGEIVNSSPDSFHKGEAKLTQDICDRNILQHRSDSTSLSSAGKGVSLSANDFLESIDSDEEGDLIDEFTDSPSNRAAASPSEPGHERISSSKEDENLNAGGKYTEALANSGSLITATQDLNSGPSKKGKETEKAHAVAHFSEHQEELDYEETEADDGGSKPKEPLPLPQAVDGKDGCIKEKGSDKDEGELSDDDCEEGEIKEPGSRRPFVKPMCRFFQRGSCTWGPNCRFLHPGVNDKGNYQMIEIPGFLPVGMRGGIGIPGPWPEPEEEVELPPPPIPDVPPMETAWERGLRIAKEQRKKASERKEQEVDFEEKRMNLSVDEDRDLSKEKDHLLTIIPKDPYYDHPGVEDDYYRDPWQGGYYENFEVRYKQDTPYSLPYQDKQPPLVPPPPLPRFTRQYSPPGDKFERARPIRREPFRPEAPPVLRDYPSPIKKPDEWTDPWRRSKSPQKRKQKEHNLSRGRRRLRSGSDFSQSSRSSSRSSSGSSRSSRSGRSSSGSSSRSRSPKPVAPCVDRYGRRISPSADQQRGATTGRGSGAYGGQDQTYYRDNRGYDYARGGSGHNQRGSSRGTGSRSYGGSNRGGRGYSSNFNGGYNSSNTSGPGTYGNNYGYEGTNAGPGQAHMMRDFKDRNWNDRMDRKRGRSPPDRPLPYVRPRPASGSSSSSSRSRSRRSSISRSSSGSSRSSSWSSSSGGSADSKHLYRDLGSPSKHLRRPAAGKRRRSSGHKDYSSTKSQQGSAQPEPQKLQIPFPDLPINLDRIPIPYPPDPKPPQQTIPLPGRQEAKYASRNAPPPPVKAKDPLKVVGQKSNIKLTLLPKQALGTRPNPLDSPPSKRRLIDRDDSLSPVLPNKPKLATLPVPQTSALRIAAEKAAKIQLRQDKPKIPQPASLPQIMVSSSSSSSSLASSPLIGGQRPKLNPQPQKQQPVNARPTTVELSVAKTVPMVPVARAPTAAATDAKAKKNMSSRREELLKQLKAVEDAIAKKKSRLL